MLDDESSVTMGFSRDLNWSSNLHIVHDDKCKLQCYWYHIRSKSFMDKYAQLSVKHNDIPWHVIMQTLEYTCSR